MAKYRKRPVVIEAEQWVSGKNINGVHTTGVPPNVVTWCDSLEGRLTVSAGDWIITGIKGEHYPCKPDIFEATYEKVED